MRPRGRPLPGRPARARPARAAQRRRVRARRLAPSSAPTRRARRASAPATASPAEPRALPVAGAYAHFDAGAQADRPRRRDRPPRWWPPRPPGRSRGRPPPRPRRPSRSSTCATPARSGAVDPERAHALRPRPAALGGSGRRRRPPTGTPRFLAGRAAPLSAPARGDRRELAERFLRGHLAALGLSRADLGSLRLQRRSALTGGGELLGYRQYVDGVPSFDGGLGVLVDAAGRVSSVSRRRAARPLAALHRPHADRRGRDARPDGDVDVAGVRVASGPAGTRRSRVHRRDGRARRVRRGHERAAGAGSSTCAPGRAPTTPRSSTPRAAASSTAPTA